MREEFAALVTADEQLNYTIPKLSYRAVKRRRQSELWRKYDPPRDSANDR